MLRPISWFIFDWQSAILSSRLWVTSCCDLCSKARLVTSCRIASNDSVNSFKRFVTCSRLSAMSAQWELVPIQLRYHGEVVVLTSLCDFGG